jgi:hypothetical protein
MFGAYRAAAVRFIDGYENASFALNKSCLPIVGDDIRTSGRIAISQIDGRCADESFGAHPFRLERHRAPAEPDLF